MQPNLICFVTSFCLVLPACQGGADGYAVSGIVKSAAPEWLDKEEEAKDKALLRTKVESDAGPVDDKIRIWIYDAGADAEESKHKYDGYSDKHIEVPAATYDLRLDYKESGLADANGWIRGVELKEGKLLRLTVVLDYPVGRVKLKPTHLGENITDKTRAWVYKPGADPEESKSIFDFWAADETVLPSGKYDLLVRYQESGLVQTDHWLRGVEVPPKRELLKLDVPIELGFSWLTVKADASGQSLGGDARAWFYTAGADPEDEKPRFDLWSAHKEPVPAGTYDVVVVHGEKKRWQKGFVVAADRQSQKLEIDLDREESETAPPAQ